MNDLKDTKTSKKILALRICFDKYLRHLSVKIGPNWAPPIGEECCKSTQEYSLVDKPIRVVVIRKKLIQGRERIARIEFFFKDLYSLPLTCGDLEGIGKAIPASGTGGSYLEDVQGIVTEKEILHLRFRFAEIETCI
jgi:hypothetical protein